MSVSAPKAIRIRTAEGWQDIALTGPGVPTGGAIGQVLSKASANDFDTQWAAPPGWTTVQATSDPWTAQPSKIVVVVGSGGRTINLPTPGTDGMAVRVLNDTNAPGGPVTVATTDGKKISFAGSYAGTSVSIPVKARGEFIYSSTFGGQWDGFTFPATPAGLPAGGAAGQVLSKASATDYDALWAVASGGGLAYTRVSGNATALAGQFVVVTNPGYTITLPSSPNDGDTVGVAQYATNGFTTVSANKSISHGGGYGTTMILQASGRTGTGGAGIGPSCFFVYSSYVANWIAYSQSNPQSLAPIALGSYTTTAYPWDFIIHGANYSPFALTLPTTPPPGTQVGAMAVGGTLQFLSTGSDYIQIPGGAATKAQTLNIAQGASKTLIYNLSVWYPTN